MQNINTGDIIENEIEYVTGEKANDEVIENMSNKQILEVVARAIGRALQVVDKEL